MTTPGDRGGGEGRILAKAKVQVFRDLSSTLHPALGNFFNNRQFSDLTVVAPDSRKLHCHQIILCSASKRFAETLEQGECQLTFQTLVPILDTAQRLDVPAVTAACENFFREVLAPTTVCTLLRMANQYKCEDLVEQCMVLIRKRFEEVISDADFLSVDFGTLMLILTANQSTQSDVTLFRAAWFWAVADTNHVQYMQEILKVVKPPNVSFPDLLKGMPLTGLDVATLTQQMQGNPRRSSLDMALTGKIPDGSGVMNPMQGEGEEGHSMRSTSTESTPHRRDGMGDAGQEGRGGQQEASSLMVLPPREGLDERRSLTLTKPLGSARRSSPERQGRSLQVSGGDRQAGNTGKYSKGVCQVDGCYTDLSGLRDYHLRYKICEYHLKVSSIMRDGKPQRFCQQCGRFHNLVEFDGNKRSCRARLQRHNQRRRKRPDGEVDLDPVESPVAQHPRLAYMPRENDTHISPPPPLVLAPPRPVEQQRMMLTPPTQLQLPGQQPEVPLSRPNPTWGLHMLADAAHEDRSKKPSPVESHEEADKDGRGEQPHGAWVDRGLPRPAGPLAPPPSQQAGQSPPETGGRRSNTGEEPVPVGTEGPDPAAGSMYATAPSSYPGAVAGVRLLNVMPGSMPYSHMG